MTHEFTLTHTVNRPPDDVFYAFTNSPMLAEWWCDWAFLAPHRAGTYYMYWESGFHAMGQYTAFEEPNRLAFTWSDGASPACRAEVSFSATDGGTRVEVTYADIDNEDQAEQLQTHWRDGLENLASWLEDGIDLRAARRPMLGVFIGGLAHEDEHGTPQGVNISGTLPGLSAAAAGLQAGDVLVEVDGTPLTSIEDLVGTVGSHSVGDSVSVAYMRDGTRHTAEMELKARQLADIPREADRLADQLAAVYAEVMAELDGVLAGLTDEQAATFTDVEEWNIRQILGHLVANEKDMQSLISMRAGGLVENSGYNNNSMIRIEPVLAFSPTVEALRERIAQTQAETVIAVRNLPAQFVARRGSYDRLGRDVLEEADVHYRDHIAQIERIKAAL
ncbi:MAG: PDZ domain-containing protein [Chloroflexi bacterium]|nr:PDZ domain-containing protein [Chloroflexota bacterium]